MFSLSDILQQAQDGRGVENLARQFGISPQEATAALDALTPALSAGLQSRAQDPRGLADLFGAMFNERHQQAFENPAALNAREVMADGEDAIGRLFGNGQATQALAAHAAQSTGLSASLLQAMIPAVVAMIMGGLFKNMQNSGLGGMLEQLGRAGANSPGNSSGSLGDLLGQVLGGALGGGAPAPQTGRRPPSQPRPAESQTGGGLGDLLGGMLGGTTRGGGASQQNSRQGGADQIFPPGFDPSSLQTGLDALGKMLNPGSARGGQQAGLQDLLGQILGGGRR